MWTGLVAGGGILPAGRDDIAALETILLFPPPPPFAPAASGKDTWEFTINNQIQLPLSGELQLSHTCCASRNVPQGRERARSSLDLAATRPIIGEQAELVLDFADIFNNFAIERGIEGNDFTALYQNFLETQVATVGLTQVPVLRLPTRNHPHLTPSVVPT